MKFTTLDQKVYALLVQKNDGQLVVAVDCAGNIKLGPGVTLENVGKKIAETYCGALEERL